MTSASSERFLVSKLEESAVRKPEKFGSPVRDASKQRGKGGGQQQSDGTDVGAHIGAC